MNWKYLFAINRVNSNRNTDSEADKLVVQDDPRQQIDERDVGGEERHDVRRVQHAQRVHVHPIGAHPQQAKEATPADERPFVHQILLSLVT